MEELGLSPEELKILKEEVLKKKREELAWSFKLEIYQKIDVIGHGLKLALEPGVVKVDSFAFGMWDFYFRQYSGLPSVGTLSENKPLTRKIRRIFKEVFDIRELEKIWDRIEKADLPELREIWEKEFPQWEKKLEEFRKRAEELIREAKI